MHCASPRFYSLVCHLSQKMMIYCQKKGQLVYYDNCLTCPIVTSHFQICLKSSQAKWAEKLYTKIFSGCLNQAAYANSKNPRL